MIIDEERRRNIVYKYDVGIDMTIAIFLAIQLHKQETGQKRNQNHRDNTSLSRSTPFFRAREHNTST